MPSAQGRSPAGGSGLSAGREEKYEENTVYELFVALVTVLSLLVMLALMAIPGDWPLFGIFAVMDLLLCFVLFVDFLIKVFRAKSKRAYMKTGWMDLLGSMPALPGFRLVAVIRLFRLYRLYSSFRVLRVRKPSYIVRELIRRRAEATFYLTLLAALVLLIVCSSVVALAEPGSADATILDADDAIWWAYVTITTVGYGDVTPVTYVGRLAGMVLMAFGIAIFGVLTSFLASVFVARPRDAALNAAAGGLPGGVGAADDLVDLPPLSTGEHAQAGATALPTPSGAGQAVPGALLLRVAAVQAELADIERALRELASPP